MFARVASVFVLALPLLATAATIRRNDLASADDCSGGSIQCCNSVQDPTSATAAALLANFGVPAGSFTGSVGLTCSPLSFIGGSGTSCNRQAACCTGNSFNGLIVIGCSPININL